MRLRKSREEQLAIKWALAKRQPWGVDTNIAYNGDPRASVISGFKNRVKAYHLALQAQVCCYCRVDLNNRNIETDREHIIPKEKFPFLSYEVFNLSVACKTCNMTVKNRKTTHLVDFGRTGNLVSKNILDERNYHIVHPNIHDWDEHIELLGDQGNRLAARIYYPVTARGTFTYDFFQLKNFERISNNQAQRGVAAWRSPVLHPDVLAAQKRFKQL